MSLESFSQDDLLAELRARSAQWTNPAADPPGQKHGATRLVASRVANLRKLPVVPVSKALVPQRNPALEAFTTGDLLKAVVDKQKVVYGNDDRADLFNITDAQLLNDADCVVALFRDAAVVDNGNGTSTLTTQLFRTRYNLCAGERFGNQPVGAFCSGFLVGPALVATAGHCVDLTDVATARFVFGYRMQNATTANTVVPNGDVYRGVSLLGRILTGGGADWALVQLDRAVAGHSMARVRRTGRIADNAGVHVIGHPCGLPTKHAGNATARNNTPATHFVANLDTYGGNSGSPVFNSNTHEIEGILVRGETDFTSNGTCNVSLVCPTTGCRGEDVTRASEFSNLLSAFTLQTGTPLHETDSTFSLAVASNNDVFAFKKSNTGSQSTEVHVLSAASGYQAWALQTGTALHETDGRFAFALAPNRDVVAIKKSGTGTGSTEIHVLSAASNYSQFSLQTGTALHETDDTFDFLIAPNNDLIAIKKSGTGTGTTEIHILSAASGYSQFSLHTGTPLHETDDTFAFAVDGKGNIAAIKRSRCGTFSTEVHILDAATSFQTCQTQTGTILHETDRTFEFGLANDRQLVALKKSNTGSKSTEVHVIDYPGR
jgi:hypothetical protein